MPNLTERIIGAAFVGGDFTFADGTAANNKLEAERLTRHPELFKEVVSGLAQLAMSFEPDLITFVPNGAKIFADPVAEQLDLPVAELWKQPKLGELGGRMVYRRPKDRKTVLDSKVKQIVIIEDISRTFSSPNQVLSLEGMGEKAAALISILHRGDPAAQTDYQIPAESLVKRYLNPEMDKWELAEYAALSANSIPR